MNLRVERAVLRARGALLRAERRYLLWRYPSISPWDLEEVEPVDPLLVHARNVKGLGTSTLCGSGSQTMSTFSEADVTCPKCLNVLVRLRAQIQQSEAWRPFDDE